MPSVDLASLSPLKKAETTHFSVWDRDGNVVSNTYTLNFSYGNGIAVGGAGFLLTMKWTIFLQTWCSEWLWFNWWNVNSIEPFKGLCHQ